MSTLRLLARNLAAALLNATASIDDLVSEGAAVVGRRPGWLRSLAERVLAAFGEQWPPPEELLTSFIARDPWFRRVWLAQRKRGTPEWNLAGPPSRMNPRAGAPSTWNLPPLRTPAELAEWLGFSLPELDWFADCRGLQTKAPPGPLHHYVYEWRQSDSGKWRLLEKPKQRLKAIQRRLLHHVLDAMPPHEAAHGYRRGRSLASYVAPHAGQAIVLRFDLRDFFPSIRRSRVHALFRTAGYPGAVARLLAGLCTNTVSRDVCRLGLEPENARGLAERHRVLGLPHLPQGAPTSPALANLCAFRLDCRLAAVAKRVGAQYTRYADDLAFSGGAELARCARRFQVLVCRIALEEGFEVHTQKSRFMRQGVRQQLAGVVLNAHPTIRRGDYERLKAILHNCAYHGPATQNRDGHADFRAHLAGRIAFVAMLHPARGQKLRRLFDRISWGNQEKPPT